jgi:hypothetical protein
MVISLAAFGEIAGVSDKASVAVTGLTLGRIAVDHRKQ